MEKKKNSPCPRSPFLREQNRTEREYNTRKTAEEKKQPSRWQAERVCACLGQCICICIFICKNAHIYTESKRPTDRPTVRLPDCLSYSALWLPAAVMHYSFAQPTPTRHPPCIMHFRIIYPVITAPGLGYLVMTKSRQFDCLLLNGGHNLFAHGQEVKREWSAWCCFFLTDPKVDCWHKASFS